MRDEQKINFSCFPFWFWGGILVLITSVPGHCILVTFRKYRDCTIYITNDITTLALYGHGSETILFFSMGHGKVIHFPIIIWFYKHFL